MQFTVVDPTLAYGPVVWFITPTGAMDIRMVDNMAANVIAAAQTLKARFFIKHHKIGIGLGDGWGVFDMDNLNPPTNFIPIAVPDRQVKSIRPVKMFDLAHHDGAIMWATMQGAKR